MEAELKSLIVHVCKTPEPICMTVGIFKYAFVPNWSRHFKDKDSQEQLLHFSWATLYMHMKNQIFPLFCFIGTKYNICYQ